MNTVPTSSTNFDPWFANYADRTAQLSASEVRALFAVASRPEVVSLAGGMPYVSALPEQLVMETMQRVVHDFGPIALQYGGGQGILPLREQILEVMELEGIHGSADDVVVTTGSQHALDLVTKLFINPGDVILAESPSYVGALGVFKSYQADVRHIAMDADGMIPEALREKIAQVKSEGKAIKLLYLIPNFHNPAGITLSWKRRIEILEIAKEAGILILEDNPYGQLYFDKAPPSAIRSLDQEQVIYLGSFSKTFAPGLRIGWALAPHAVREKLILAAEAAVLSPSNFAQYTISEFLNHSDWRQQIQTFRGVYHERKNATISALKEYLPKLSWTNPNGGFYVWLNLPPELDSKAMLPRAVKELVAYTPGTAFYADGQGNENIRICFSYPTPDRINEGIRRLATVVNNELELVNTFKPATTPVRVIKPENRVISPPPNIG